MSHLRFVGPAARRKFALYVCKANWCWRIGGVKIAYLQTLLCSETDIKDIKDIKDGRCYTQTHPDTWLKEVLWWIFSRKVTWGTLQNPKQLNLTANIFGARPDVFSLWSCQFVVSRHLWKTYIFTKCHEISWLQNLLITDSKDYLFSWGVLKPDMISYGRGNAEHRRSLMTIQAQAAKWTKNNVHLSSWLMVLFINGWIYAYKYIYIYMAGLIAIFLYRPSSLWHQYF